MNTQENKDHDAMLEIALIGGPLDGDSVVMAPLGSLRPPQRFQYLGTMHHPIYKLQPAWITYEIENKAQSRRWGKQDRARYIYRGSLPLIEDKKMKIKELWKPSESDKDWTRKTMDMLKIGGTWAIPYCESRVVKKSTDACTFYGKPQRGERVIITLREIGYKVTVIHD